MTRTSRERDLLFPQLYLNPYWEILWWGAGLLLKLWWGLQNTWGVYTTKHHNQSWILFHLDPHRRVLGWTHGPVSNLINHVTRDASVRPRPPGRYLSLHLDCLIRKYNCNFGIISFYNDLKGPVGQLLTHQLRPKCHRTMPGDRNPDYYCFHSPARLHRCP